MKPQDNEEKDKLISSLLSSVDRGGTPPDKEFLDRLRERSVAEFRAHSAGEETQAARAKAPVPTWLCILRGRAVKLAAAAVIVAVAVIGAIRHFGGGESSEFAGLPL